jgi:hypothetical protein
LNIAIWVLAVACMSLMIYLLLHRTSATEDKSAERLALLVGARRVFGESNASLRRRAIALSRWPYYAGSARTGVVGATLGTNVAATCPMNGGEWPFAVHLHLVVAC